MGKHQLGPQRLDAEQMESYLANEAQFAGQSPDVIVWGDSRAKMLQSGFLRRDGFDSAANSGVAHLTVEGWLWELNHSAIDQSQAHVAVVEVGINSERILQDSAQDVVGGIIQGVNKLSTHLAEGAHIYVVEVYDALPGTYLYDQDLNDEVNAKLAAKADHSGKFIFVPVDLDFDTDYRDGQHLNDSGNAKVHEAIEASMAAHGDMPPPEAPQHVIGVSGDPFLLG